MIVLPISPTLNDERLLVKRKSEWSLSSYTDEINNRHLYELGDNGTAISKSALGAHFERNSTRCLAAPYNADLFPSTGFAVAICFRLEDMPNPNGETLVKAWLFKDEKKKYFLTNNVDDGIIFSFNLLADRHLRFILAPATGFSDRETLDSSEVIQPHRTYFACAQYDVANQTITLAVAAHSEELTFNTVAFSQPLGTKKIPLMIGCQELGRASDPEFTRGYIKRVGVYAPLTSDEISKLAWEYGTYPYGSYLGNLEDGYMHVDGDTLVFPKIKSGALLAPTEVDILQASHHSLITAFLQHQLPLLKIYRLVRDAWTPVEYQEVNDSSRDTNHSILELNNGNLMLTLVLAKANLAIDYRDPNTYYAKFALASSPNDLEAFF